MTMTNPTDDDLPVLRRRKPYSPSSVVASPLNDSQYHRYSHMTREEFENQPGTFWHGTASGHIGIGSVPGYTPGVTRTSFRSSRVGAGTPTEQPFHVGTYQAAEENLMSRLGYHKKHYDDPGDEESPSHYWVHGDEELRHAQTTTDVMKDIAKQGGDPYRYLDVEPPQERGGFHDVESDIRARGGSMTAHSYSHPAGVSPEPGSSSGFAATHPEMHAGRIVGPMFNTPETASSDWGSDSLGQKQRWRESGHGQYYTNRYEDEGSLSAVLPHRSHFMTHEDYIIGARARGMRVPKHVLADYPHLGQQRLA